MKIEREIIDNIIVLTPTFRVMEDMFWGERLIGFEEEFKEDSDYILNMINIKFIDSSGIGKIIGICLDLKEKNKKFCISNTTEIIKSVFYSMRLDEIVPIEDNIQKAIERIKKI